MCIRDSRMADSFRQVRHLAVVHLRYYFCLPAALCVSLLLFTSVVFPPAGLSSQQAAVPLEYMVSLIGIILMVPAASYRQSSRIQDPRDRIGNRGFSMFMVRLLIALGALFLCTGIFTLYLYISGSQVFLFHFTDAFITAFFLGSMGMLAQTLCSRSCAAGYLSLIHIFICIPLRKWRTPLAGRKNRKPTFSRYS